MKTISILTAPAQKALRASKKLINERILHSWDIRNGDGAFEHAPVFILGAPRCGSTLLIQLMAKHLRVGYFNNFHAHFYGAPSLAARFVNSSSASKQTEFKSEHGHTKGWTSPSENPAFWYRFFRRQPAYVPLAEMPAQKGGEFRASLLNFSHQFSGPIVIKNLYATLRLEVIRHFIPEARFIVLHRELADNAASLLNGRHKVFGRYDRWWSVEVPDFEQLLAKDPAVQVIEQITRIYQIIDSIEERTAHPREHFLHLDYAALCADPKTTLEQIGGFIHADLLVSEASELLERQISYRKSHVANATVAASLSKHLS